MGGHHGLWLFWSPTSPAPGQGWDLPKRGQAEHPTSRQATRWRVSIQECQGRPGEQGGEEGRREQHSGRGSPTAVLSTEHPAAPLLQPGHEEELLPRTESFRARGRCRRGTLSRAAAAKHISLLPGAREELLHLPQGAFNPAGHAQDQGVLRGQANTSLESPGDCSRSLAPGKRQTSHPCSKRKLWGTVGCCVTSTPGQDVENVLLKEEGSGDSSQDLPRGNRACPSAGRGLALWDLVGPDRQGFLQSLCPHMGEICTGDVDVAQSDQDRLAGTSGVQPSAWQGGAVMSPTEGGPRQALGSQGPSPAWVSAIIFPCPGEGLGLLQGLSLPRAPSQTMGWRIPPSPSSLGVRRASVCSLTGRVNYPRDSLCCWSFGFFLPEFPVDGSGLCAFPIPAALPG